MRPSGRPGWRASTPCRTDHGPTGPAGGGATRQLCLECLPLARHTVKTAAYILKSKPDPTVHVIAPDATVFEAVARMAEHNIGALMVMDGETLVGIVSERDYSRKIVLRGRS